MASDRSSTRYSLRNVQSRKNIDSRKRDSGSDGEEGENSAKEEVHCVSDGVESIVPRTRRSQRLQKKVRFEVDLDASSGEKSSPEHSDSGDKKFIPTRRSQRLQKKLKTEEVSRNSEEVDDDLEDPSEPSDSDDNCSNDDEVSSENDSNYDMAMSNGPTCSICETEVANNFVIKCKNSKCTKSFHTFCLNPPLNEIQNDWICPVCSDSDTQLSSRKIQRLVGHRKLDLEGSKCNSQLQFLVKWDSFSHHHDSWIPLEWLHIFDRSRLYSYQRKYTSSKDGSESMDSRKPEWFQIHRVISCHRKSEPNYPFEISNSILKNQNESEFKFLVKWRGLDYSESTWESLKESLIRDELRGEIAKFVERHNQEGCENNLGENEGVIGESVPEVYKDILYDYQIQGVQWMINNFKKNNNVILADEMGLGKTVQVVCFLQSLMREKLNPKPALIIAPKSILFQWEKEFGKWGKEMNVIVYQGDKESRKCIQAHEFYSFTNKPLFNALVTSYEIVQLDSTVLKKFNWSCVIIDEAHKLKNLYCKLFACLKQYVTDFRLLLTGTPLQNTILELFALLHFIDPDEFSDPEFEAKSFTNLQQSELKISQIHEILKPRMLRRLKSNVMREKIPVKKWVEIPCALSKSQRELYIDILEKNYAKLNKKIEGGKKNALNCILMDLKKCCNHPYLFEGQEPYESSDESAFSSLVASSGKLQFLEKLLPKLKERGNRVIIFSQMTKMLDILEDFLSFLNFSYFRIDGQTSLSTRQENMKDYNSAESNIFIFLMSTRAGGVGIDLPSADRVIIYDPDFNPFMDLQAQSRAHRIGQTRPVMVYQLITKSTIEEKILQKSKEKLAMENLVMNQTKNPTTNDLHSVLLHGARDILNRKKILATSIEYDDVAIENLLKMDPVLGDVCGPDDDGYLGSIESFKNGASDEVVGPSPRKEDWKKVLGGVVKEEEEEKIGIEDFGRGKRVKRQVNYQCDEEEDDDEVYAPESSRSGDGDDDDEEEEEDGGGDGGYVQEKFVNAG